MADFKFMKTSARAAIVAALAITSVSTAQARPNDDNNERGSWSRGGDTGRNGANESRNRGETRSGRELRDSGETRGGGRERGPGYGRDWNDGGTVSRPAAASGGAAPAIPDRGGRTIAGNPGGETTRAYSELRRVEPVATDRRVDRRDGARDGWRDRNRDNNWRSGSRDGGTRWSGGDHHRWDGRDWRRDSRYNWSQYRSSHRDHYRAGRYYSPYRSYNYSRLSIGFYLDAGFYGRNYWINDPWSYRLPEVYGPYRWVRYYDDVLLVDVYNGEVVDVIYDFFW